MRPKETSLPPSEASGKATKQSFSNDISTLFQTQNKRNHSDSNPESISLEALDYSVERQNTNHSNMPFAEPSRKSKPSKKNRKTKGIGKNSLSSYNNLHQFSSLPIEETQHYYQTKQEVNYPDPSTFKLSTSTRATNVSPFSWQPLIPPNSFGLRGLPMSSFQTPYASNLLLYTPLIQTPINYSDVLATRLLNKFVYANIALNQVLMSNTYTKMFQLALNQQISSLAPSSATSAERTEHRLPQTFPLLNFPHAPLESHYTHSTPQIIQEGNRLNFTQEFQLPNREISTVNASDSPKLNAESPKLTCANLTNFSFSNLANMNESDENTNILGKAKNSSGKASNVALNQDAPTENPDTLLNIQNEEQSEGSNEMAVDSTQGPGENTTFACSNLQMKRFEQPRRRARKIEFKRCIYKCNICKRSYATLHTLAKHRKTHEKKSNITTDFICTVCNKRCISRNDLQVHKKSHNLPYVCNVCKKSFNRSWLLQGHMRTHTGEKPFACNLCSRPFADRSNLRAHMQIHEVVKRYSCSRCDKTFSRVSQLTRHEKTCDVQPTDVSTSPNYFVAS